MNSDAVPAVPAAIGEIGGIGGIISGAFTPEAGFGGMIGVLIATVLPWFPYGRTPAVAMFAI
ncbi:hypothetical protein [Saccharopolyspora spinosa]|uniref:Uncharacterized protein n=1 Tax=Saccharopolyspora spinosa TaxID=60894 RepID=A0A2N3XRK8_SACSN|nr:hypothetical protein A8926_0780 [Saccharopolyspora spinosa]